MIEGIRWIGLFASVAAGGAIGAMARFGCSLFASRFDLGGLPIGTFVVNVAGCFLLGWLAEVYGQSGAARSILYHAAAVGFLGSFTTFSTFSMESFQLFEGGMGWRAAGYILASVAVGLAGVKLGVEAGRYFLH